MPEQYYFSERIYYGIQLSYNKIIIGIIIWIVFSYTPKPLESSYEMAPLIPFLQILDS